MLQKEMKPAAREENNTWASTKEGDAGSGSPSVYLQHMHQA
jgi:hypothetical protein